MTTTHKQRHAPGFAERILSTVDAYRNAPDRDEHDLRSIANVQDEVRTFEQRYNLKSSEIHHRIDDGTLVETVDVSRWIFAVNKLERAKAKQD